MGIPVPPMIPYGSRGHAKGLTDKVPELELAKPAKGSRAPRQPETPDKRISNICDRLTDSIAGLQYSLDPKNNIPIHRTHQHLLDALRSTLEGMSELRILQQRFEKSFDIFEKDVKDTIRDFDNKHNKGD